MYQKSRRPLGVLACRGVTTQGQLDALTATMKNERLDLRAWRSSRDILAQIRGNAFFHRAWICQELVSSGG